MAGSGEKGRGNVYEIRLRVTSVLGVLLSGPLHTGPLCMRSLPAARYLQTHNIVIDRKYIAEPLSKDTPLIKKPFSLQTTVPSLK